MVVCVQITTRLNEAIPRMIPRLNNELHQLQDQQKKLQELKPKIEEVVGGGKEGVCMYVGLTHDFI